jgi:hypothetical protein
VASLPEAAAARDTGSLRDLQRAFCRAVLSGDGAGASALIRSDGIPAEQRVQIYRNNTRAAFLATLAASFPVIGRLGGAGWFRQSALEYQRAFPSRSGDLQFIGDRYADFLQDCFAGTQYGYFCDVAKLEWAYQEVLTAADSAPLDPASLAAVAAEDYARLAFVLRPAVRLVESQYPILAIWRANQPGVDTPGVAQTVVSLDAGPSRVLVMRRAGFIELREVSAATAALFSQFSRGAPFASAAAAVLADHAESALGGSLRELITLESIQGFAFD